MQSTDLVNHSICFSCKINEAIKLLLYESASTPGQTETGAKGLSFFYQTSVFRRSDVGSDVVEPALGFISGCQVGDIATPKPAL